jgi:hypothetical protein
MFRGPRAGLRHSATVIVAVVPLLAAAVPRAVRADEQLDGALATMARMKIVESPAEWREQALKGRFCDGSRVDDLLQRLAGAFEPVKSRDEALAVLSRKKIIWNDSWREQAVSGRQCEGEYVATLLRVAAAPLADQELIASQAVPDGILVYDEPTAFATTSASSGSGGVNAVIGTQTFDPSYRFTRKPRLVETAEAIRHTPREQDRLSRQVMRAGLEWGTPLILSWELYNNEVEADGRQRGYWLIDDKGVKQPAYETHASFLAWARRHVEETIGRSGRPTSAPRCSPTSMPRRPAASDRRRRQPTHEAPVGDQSTKV